MGSLLVHVCLPVPLDLQARALDHTIRSFSHYPVKVLTINDIPRFFQLLFVALFVWNFNLHVSVLVTFLSTSKAVSPSRRPLASSFIFCLSFHASRVVNRLVHVMIWWLILNLGELSLVLLFGTFDSWVFFGAPRDSSLQMPILSLLLSFQSLTALLILLHPPHDPQSALVVVRH